VESKYNALSMSMRDVLPLLLFTKIIANALVGVTKIAVAEFQATKHKPEKLVQFETDIQFETATFKTTLHKDNTGAMILAKMEPGRMTPRSKHYGVRYHWFRTKLKPNEIEIDRIDTKLQRADFLTKSHRTKTFEANRKLTMGW
jgi:hypothetical protein